MPRKALVCLLAATFGLMLLLPAAYAGKKDDTLRIASNLEVENVDAYFNNAREGIVLARLIWDALLWRNPKTGKYEGALAKSWRWVNPTTIDVELRQGIVFHNGQKFDADDVVYTINYVTDPANKAVTGSNVNWMKNAEKRGPFSVRINLKAPFPAAFEYLAGPVPIYPHEYYAKVGPQGMGLKPVGTGPYRVTEVQPGKLVVLEKNPDYFKDSPQGQPSIGKIEYRTIPETNTQLAELLSGGLDWVWRVQLDQMPQLAANPDLKVLASETMRIGFVGYEADNKNPSSPTNKLKVREAMNYAINRDSIRVNLIGGVTRVVDSPCFPEQFGCVDKGVKKYPYDPALAKKLLAEAGYPNGFTIDLYTYATYDRPYVEAMVGDWRAVGITANLRVLQYAAWRDEVRAGHAQLFYGSWGSFSIQDVSAFTGYYFKFGPDDTTRDPQLRDWLEAGDTSIDPKVRLENYTKAMRRIATEAYWLPCFTYSLNYAFTKDLEFTANVDEIPRFVNSKWK
jgi:peptide/nickel transport system substrate-binding protein